MTDECTTNRYRISYARVLVEIDITQDLLSEITITYERGEKMQQRVEYEWRPPYCTKCQRIGHKCEEMHLKNPTKQWIPKEKKHQDDIVAVKEVETLKTPTQKVTRQEHTISGSIVRMTNSKQTDTDEGMAWTEVRRKDKVKANGFDTGSSPKNKKPMKNDRNLYATLGDDPASVFLDDVP
ncbi:unnamed protein product [Lathyrus sativus]|nr:unnamed protein product [Lathyrus sativus]